MGCGSNRFECFFVMQFFFFVDHVFLILNGSKLNEK